MSSMLVLQPATCLVIGTIFCRSPGMWNLLKKYVFFRSLKHFEERLIRAFLQSSTVTGPKVGTGEHTENGVRSFKEMGGLEVVVEVRLD